MDCGSRVEVQRCRQPFGDVEAAEWRRQKSRLGIVTGMVPIVTRQDIGSPTDFTGNKSAICNQIVCA